MHVDFVTMLRTKPVSTVTGHKLSHSGKDMCGQCADSNLRTGARTSHGHDLQPSACSNWHSCLEVTCAGSAERVRVQSVFSGFLRCYESNLITACAHCTGGVGVKGFESVRVFKKLHQDILLSVF